MRRFTCLGVALAALLTVPVSSPGAPKEMSSSEQSKIRSDLETYFKESDWQQRESSLLRQVDRTVAELNARRVRSKKGNCLADLAGLLEVIFESQDYDSQRRKGLRLIKWEDSPFPGIPPEFYLSIPRRYRPDEPTPLILALHPLGVDAESYVEDVFLESRDIEQEYLVVAPVWPDRTKSSWGAETKEGAGRLLIGLYYAIHEFLVDPDRIYVVGEAEGGTAALDLAMSFADRFAGVFAIGGGKPRALEANLKLAPVHRLEGAAERPHKPAYAKVLETIQAEDGLRRSPYPKTVEWQFTEELGQQLAWWVFVSRGRKIDEDTGPRRIRAEIKEGNVIEVTTVGVDAFHLYLNDELVNLDEEVHVVINGEKQPPWQPERRLSHAVEWMMNNGDLGRIFVSEKEFAVPLEEEDEGNGD